MTESTIPATFTANLRRILTKIRNEAASRANRIKRLEDDKRRLQDQIDRLQRTLDSLGHGHAFRDRMAHVLEMRVRVDLREFGQYPAILDHAIADLRAKVKAELR